MEVGDVDVDGLAGFDVGDLLLEYVRPPLHEQARPVALGSRLAVDGLGFFLFAQNAANRTVPMTITNSVTAACSGNGKT